jgi:hypothetical protein
VFHLPASLDLDESADVVENVVFGLVAELDFGVVALVMLHAITTTYR